jgi:hypothetical protein
MAPVNVDGFFTPEYQGGSDVPPAVEPECVLVEMQYDGDDETYVEIEERRVVQAAEAAENALLQQRIQATEAAVKDAARAPQVNYAYKLEYPATIVRRELPAIVLPPLFTSKKPNQPLTLPDMEMKVDSTDSPTDITAVASSRFFDLERTRLTAVKDGAEGAQRLGAGDAQQQAPMDIGSLPLEPLFPNPV